MFIAVQSPHSCAPLGAQYMSLLAERKRIMFVNAINMLLLWSKNIYD